MTEQEWLACDDPGPMLNALDQGSERKLRLFAVACCRRVWDHITLPPAQESVQAAERFADGHISADELASAHGEASGAESNYDPGHAAATAVSESRMNTNAVLFNAILAAAAANPNRRVFSLFELIADNPFQPSAAEVAAQAVMLRHIVGNPLRPYPAPASWPSTVVSLAEALYNGQDCSFPLHDALLEAGHTELAEHFRKETWHPKGCWVVDLIVGKK